MLDIKFETLVNQVVRQELIEKGRENEGLYFNFDCRLSHYTNKKTYNESCGLHLVYNTSLGSSYVHVFSGLTNNVFARIKDVDYWKHECSHDSCWRDIGIFAEVYFDMAKRINSALVIDGLKETAPKNMHENNSFNGFDKVFSWVKVKVSKDPDDRNNYRKVLELLPPDHYEILGPAKNYHSK